MKQLITIIIITLLICSCKKEKKLIEPVKNDQKSATLILDKSSISSYFISHPEKKTIIQEVALFYKNRDYKYAWTTNNSLNQNALNLRSELSNYNKDFNDNLFNTKQLDSLIVLVKKDSSKTHSEKLELVLTTTFFKYSQKANTGINKTPNQLEWYIPRKKQNNQELLETLISDNNDAIVVEPVNSYYVNLKEKLQIYNKISEEGGFPLIKTEKNLLRIADSDSSLIQVKKRLFLTGDLKNNDKTILFTDSLTIAITHFQERLGLPENGKLDANTILELNKSVEFRIKQILVNLERLRWIPTEIENEYLLVNIPEFKLHVFENKKLVWKTNVVVGKAAKKTIVFKGNISRIILNPYWNIPNSIINNEILPKLKHNSNYLVQNNMEVVSNSGNTIPLASINWKKYTKNVPFIIRQKPGKSNALGKMKFLFPNNFNIYLHDTPSKSLFNRNKRDFSHGCIRVEDPKKLAIHLLKNNKTWTPEKLDKALLSTVDVGIQVKPNIPVYITYFTAWVDNKGNLNFRNDIYNLDEELSKNIIAK